MPPPLRAALAIGLLALVFLAGPGLVRAEPTVFGAFLPSGLYVLRIDGVEVEDATIYQSKSSAAFLVLAEVLADGVLVLPRRNCIERVSAAEIRRIADDALEVVKTEVPCSLGAYRLEGPNVVFQMGERTARLTPTPPLLGPQTARAVLKHTPEYVRGAKAYQPDPEAIRRLKASTHNVRIEVYFGSWCSFCTRFLPGILRVEGELAGTGLEFVYHGLPAPPAAWVSPEAVRHKIKKLITGILTVDGKEIGRIVGNDWILPEKALLQHLP